MSITLLGTCRLDSIRNHNNLNNMINYPHSTKEVIQQIRYIKGELDIFEPYNTCCFRTALDPMLRKPIIYNDSFYDLFSKTETFVIEISSIKKYSHNGFYLHHLSVDKRYPVHNGLTPPEILNNFIIEKQSDEEIENDILEIQRLLSTKKIVFVSHYNTKLNGEYLEVRKHLIELLEDICTRHNINFINPALALSNYTQEQVILPDLEHYTDFGKKVISDYFNEYIENM